MIKKQIESKNLRLMVFESAKELGEKIDSHLLKMYGYDSSKETFILPIKENFFSDGHLKVEIEDSVRGKSIFAITDIGNYSVEYKIHNYINHASPNDLIMQLKDGIGSCNSHAHDINIIMPLLYAGRQHRRITRENLTCGRNLKELEMTKHLKSIITFDAHDESVEHALDSIEFDNFLPINAIIKEFVKVVPKKDLLDLNFVAPDNGATGRRNVYLNSFNVQGIKREAGSFIKRRDYNQLVDGKYPVISHDYCGNTNLEGKTAIVVDDMISSGGSMFDVIEELKKRNVKKIYIFTTYALFTEGIEKFKKYYNNNMLDGLFTTNLSYIPKDYHQEKWLHICDCSKMIAEIIYNINENKTISPILRDRSEILKYLNKKINKK